MSCMRVQDGTTMRWSVLAVECCLSLAPGSTLRKHADVLTRLSADFAVRIALPI